MKQMNFPGGSIVTGTAVADSLLEYATHIARAGLSVPVDVPVLEVDGSITRHSILLTGTDVFDVFDIGGNVVDEDEAFPLPTFPAVGGRAYAIPIADAHTVFPDIADAV